MMFRRKAREQVPFSGYNENGLIIPITNNAIPRYISLFTTKPEFRELKKGVDYGFSIPPTASGVSLNMSLEKSAYCIINCDYEEMIFAEGGSEYVMKINGTKDGLVLNEIELGTVGKPKA